MAVAALSILVACTMGGITSVTAPIDLHDPELQRRLGLGPPEGVSWRRTVEGMEVTGIGTAPDPAELQLIGAALQEVPAALGEEATPRTIVRTEDVAAEELHEQAAALTRGPDVYLLDRSFQITPGGSTRVDLARAYLHELAHVAQFYALEPDYVQAVLDGRLGTLEIFAGSRLVRGFAAATGWQDRSDDPLQADWDLPEGVGASTPYGRARPDEDMAESVALVATGRAEWLPPDRAAWVEEWLEASADELAAGTPWAPVGSAEVLSAQAVYDEEAVGELDFQHAEPLYFALPPDASPHDQLAATIEGRLADRGLEGSLERHPDDRLPRYAGLFHRSDGLAYRVELWDFREGSGFAERPDHPVLTYVVLW